jgi:hypothetical protein
MPPKRSSAADAVATCVCRAGKPLKAGGCAVDFGCVTIPKEAGSAGGFGFLEGIPNGEPRDFGVCFDGLIPAGMTRGGRLATLGGTAAMAVESASPAGENRGAPACFAWGL